MIKKIPSVTFPRYDFSTKNPKVDRKKNDVMTS